MDAAWIRLLHSGDLEEARRSAAGEPELLAVVDAVAPLYGAVGAPARDWSDPEARAQADFARAVLHLVSLGASARPAPPGDTDWSRAAAALVAFAGGRAIEPPAALSADDPALRVTEMVLRTLAALSAGDVRDATSHARRASRAAYAEGLRGLEYLVYWCLARTRREGQNLYAATRILGALARAAPSAWWPLIDWELVLAGGGPAAADRALTEPAAIWLEAVADVEGDALARLRARPLPAGFARERDLLCDGMEGVSELADRGRVAGALYESAEQLGVTPATWALAPGAAPRLRWCVGGAATRPRRLFDEGERVQALAACLAEAGQGGAPRDALFHAVYGFDFDAVLHDGLFRVLLHRTRGALEGVAEIARDDERLRLVVEAPVELPEPRSLPPFGDRLLRTIAATPGMSAKELAERVGDKMRTVQRTLRALVETGTCRAEKRGRQTIYTVEDTTFSEPTHFGEGARGG